MGNEYKEVNDIFEGLDAHVVSSKSLIDQPYRDGDIFIEGQILETLDDGMEIELCLWSDLGYHISLWDVSIDKMTFDEKVGGDVLSYYESKGIYLGHVKDRYTEWRYCGLTDREDVYRIQYYEDKD